ncbi:MAG: hypothetical protein P8175_15385, partial [Deltaproteobacteria bacterium]
MASSGITVGEVLNFWWAAVWLVQSDPKRLLPNTPGYFPVAPEGLALVSKNPQPTGFFHTLLYK